MTQLLNFRDFGGVLTRTGQSVRGGLLFRSGHLSGLENTVAAGLLDRGFGVVVDLRYREERGARPSPWPEAMRDRIVTHAAPRDADAPHLKAMQVAMQQGGDIAAAYRDLYAALPFDRWYLPLFADALQRIADADGPILIHCSAGKDRTGLLVAMLLFLLDVPEDAVFADYLKTNGAAGMEKLRADMQRRAEAEGLPLSEAQIDQICGVDKSYLEASFAAIDQRHGSLRNYLVTTGLSPSTIDILRGRYVA